MAPFADFVGETLARYPRLRATRLFDMLAPRGYKGSMRTLRSYVASVRPATSVRASLRTETLVGEQAQVDWAFVGEREVPGGRRGLWMFVMVLSWSRMLYAECVWDLGASSLRRSLIRAHEFFGGSPRQWLFDNPRTVVLGRHGDTARFHPTVVELSSAFCTQARAVRRAGAAGQGARGAGGALPARPRPRGPRVARRGAGHPRAERVPEGGGAREAAPAPARPFGRGRLRRGAYAAAGAARPAPVARAGGARHDRPDGLRALRHQPVLGALDVGGPHAHPLRRRRPRAPARRRGGGGCALAQLGSCKVFCVWATAFRSETASAEAFSRSPRGVLPGAWRTRGGRGWGR